MEESSLTLKEIMSLRNDIEIRDKLALALGKAEERIGELEVEVKKYNRMKEWMNSKVAEGINWDELEKYLYN
tara:strand:+ start:8407 stop:8622 length:216 start_codon:yes stop_codon:yes gene_type:complete